VVTEVLMPRQGQSVESCIIIGWSVAEGDTIKEGETICEIETDKAAFEVESPASGTLLGVFYPVDSDVEVLKVIAAIGEPGEDISTLRPAENDAGEAQAQVADSVETETSKTAPPAEAVKPQAQTSSSAVSPRAKKLAENKGVDTSAIAGTGPHGRVIERDVMATQPAVVSPSAKGRATAVASMEFPGNITEIPVKGIRKLVAGRMRASLQNSAQLTHHTSADARAVLDYRKKCKAASEQSGVAGISINDAVLFATVRALTEYPELNAHWQGDKIVQYENVHLGLAVDTPRGLIVPVIRYANLMSLKQLSAEANRLAMNCIEGNVDPDSLLGGTFTVSTLGALGIESFTPVLNTPEVGILGVCNIQAKPVISGDEVEFVPHMGLSLTFDHCAVDGAPAARFLASLREKLAAFELTLAG